MAKFDRKTGQPVGDVAVENPVEVVEEVSGSHQLDRERAEFRASLSASAPSASLASTAIPAPVQNGTFTLEDVMKIVSGVVQELKKPSEIEQWEFEQKKAKVDAERSRSLKMAKQAADEAKREEAARKGAQDVCSHMREDNTTAFAGQVNSDGYVRFMCTRCFKIMPKVKAPDEWRINGVQTQAAADVSGGMRFITKDHVMAWHKGTVPDCQEPCCK